MVVCARVGLADVGMIGGTLVDQAGGGAGRVV